MKLLKPLCIIDLETTGLDIINDQIIELGIWKINPDNTGEYYERKIKPTVPIKKEAYEKHKLTEKDLKDCPLFKEIIPEVITFLKGCDIGGYNVNKFDLPFLVEEMMRNGFELDLTDVNIVDSMVIYHHFFKRNLESCYKHYIGEDMVGAHAVRNDIEATARIFMKQAIEHSNELGDSIESISDFTYDKSIVDVHGYLSRNEDGEVVMNFGKHSGVTLQEMWLNESGYLDWMLKSNFPILTKSIIKESNPKLNELSPKHHDDLPF